MSATDTHEGRRYVVTGAASGIGRATATLLASRGARVVVADRDELVAGQVADQLEGAVALGLDVTSRESWEGARDVVEERLGGLDGLVNNAGITQDKSLRKMRDAEWHAVLEVHLRGSWLGCQTLADLLASGPSGSIVNISSSGRHGAFGQSNYAAAKAGVVGLTKTVALELARSNVRCNAVAPGAVDTPMISDVPEHVRQQWLTSITLGRLGRPEEIGEAVAFLLSPAAGFITAHVLDVTGGETHL